MTRLLCALLLATGLSAFAQRPPATGHASPELLAPTGGAKYLASLPEAVRKSFEKDGYALLPQQQREKDDGMLKAVIKFDRPREEVFDIITRPSLQKTYLPSVTESKTWGERSAEGEAIDTEVRMLFTFRFRTQHWFYPEEHRMEWALDPNGADSLTAQTGFFQLYELDEKTTLAEYGTRVQMRNGFLNFIRGIGEKGGVKDAIDATRKHVAKAKVERGGASQAASP